MSLALPAAGPRGFCLFVSSVVLCVCLFAVSFDGFIIVYILETVNKIIELIYVLFNLFLLIQIDFIY